MIRNHINCRHIMGKSIGNISGTALKKLGCINRVVGRYSYEKVKETCHFALVRPHLEYEASIWDPEHKDLIRRLNKTQRKAASFVKNHYERTQSATKLILELGWGPLETRRQHARLRLLEKFRSDFFQSDTGEIILALHYIVRCDKSDKIREIHCRTDRYMNSFFPRSISDHNKH
jgi:hypothetical protein